MKKTLRKYQLGDPYGAPPVSYTGMSTSPTYQIPTSSSTLPTTLPPQSGTVPTTGLSKSKTKSNVGGGIMAGVNAAGGLASSIYGEVETGKAKINAVKSAQEDRKKYESFAGAQRVNQLLYGESGANNPYEYNAELAGKNNSKIVSNSQQQITKQATMTGLSFLPFGIGSAINMVLDPLWKVPTDESLAGGGGAKNNVGGTSIGAQSDKMFTKYGGRMPAYQMGGPRNYAGPMEEPAPNAEVERGEVTQHPDGKVEIEGGKRHEEGGNEKYVPPGAFIWSDHLKYQGKSMAQWFLMFKDNPERVEQLKALQENLASKEKPSKYNDLPKQKYGGELPKYQVGTPAATYRPYQLPVQNPTVKHEWSPFGSKFDMFEEQKAKQALAKKTVQASSVAPKTGPSQGGSLVDYLNSKGIDSSFANRKAISGMSDYRGTADQNQKLLKEYLDAEASMNNSNALAKNPPISVYGPAQGALKRQEEADVPDELVYTSLPGKAGRAPGTYSKARTILNEYGRYIPQLAGSLAQIGMLAGMEYKDLTVPQAARVANSQFTALGRVNNQAAEDQIREMYQAQLADARYRGAGPGDASQGQMAYNRAVQAIAETQRGVMNTNVNLAAQEASMNMEDKQRRDITNAAAINAQKESENANRVASENFRVQKSGALAGAFGTMGTDISKSIADKEHALAIYGNTSMNADRYGINHKEVEKLAEAAALQEAKANGRTSYTPQEYMKQISLLYNNMVAQNKG